MKSMMVFDSRHMGAEPRAGKLSLTWSEFSEDPLFRDTVEKREVFDQLQLAASDPFYEPFIQSLQRDDWVERTQGNPTRLALFSIIAYFDGLIDREEMFVINMVACAQREYDLGHIHGFRPVVLRQEEVATYLRESGVPPFAGEGKEVRFIITNRKPEEVLQEERRRIVTEFGGRSAVKRTVVEYTLKPFVDIRPSSNIEEAKLRASIEMSIFGRAGSRVGYRDVVPGKEGTMLLLPPEWAIDLFRATSEVETRRASEHQMMFGYTEDEGPFYQGVRVISICSPLVKLPSPHNYLAGSSDLSMQFHDLMYHMPLEINNGDIDQFIKIAWFLELAQQGTSSSVWREANERMRGRLLDRETHEYRKYRPARAFNEYIRGLIQKYVKPVFAREEDLNKWKERILRPIFEELHFSFPFPTVL